MAVHHTCDRCGRRCINFAKIIEKVTSGLWHEQAGENALRECRLTVSFVMPDADDDVPDLCTPCKLDLLNVLSNKLLARFHDQLTENKETYRVQVMVDPRLREWVNCVREDIEQMDTVAEFPTREECAQFIDNVRGLMHMGGGATHFRILRVGPDGNGTPVTEGQ